MSSNYIYQLYTVDVFACTAIKGMLPSWKIQKLYCSTWHWYFCGSV